MVKRNRFILSLLSCIVAAMAFTISANARVDKNEQPKEYRYRLTLRDKAQNPFSVRHPEKFLSQKSIERRKRFGLSVDEYDLPITPAYISAITATGAKVFNCSKWNNTVQVSICDTADVILSQLRSLPFVKEALLVYVAPDTPGRTEAKNRESLVTNKLKVSLSADSLYGFGQRQADLLNLPALHEQGFKGQGMTIAVIDGGFYNADCIEALRNTRVMGTRNFTRPNSSVYEEHRHGMMVLSCISTNVPRSFIGTAPEASFYLLESEDTWYEYQGEEDNWCAALEYADSLGVDVVTSSLGYTHFDTPAVKMQYHWLDGKHELNSRSASLAASRGILLCNSAGNEGDSSWKKIGFPADAKDILTVGAVDAKGCNTDFSSVGNCSDGRIKPDCMAMGGQSCVLNIDGSLTTTNGTSFACPILAGAVTCLMQACPKKKPSEIIEAIHNAGNNAAYPDNVFGYGIPDMMKAYELLK